MNYFVEGIQGAGKSTMTEKLFREHPEYTVFREGDYCPVELARCAYVDEVGSWADTRRWLPRLRRTRFLEGSGEENTHGGVCGACIDTMPRDPINNT